MPPLPRRRALPVLGVALLLALVATAAAPGLIRIRRGDTLSHIAQRYGTTVEALQQVNGLRGTLIFEGRTLRIPGRATTFPVRRVATKPVAARTSLAPPRAHRQLVYVVHVVRSGDSLIRIARKFGVDPNVVARHNKLPPSRIVRLGAHLAIPIVRTVTPGSAAATRPGRVSRDTVRTLIVRESRRAGIDPNLAIALAWQESGLQQHVTSSAGAVGAMQVMPGTGDWVARYLVRRPLNLRNVEDNVVAGVQYLALLLRVAGSTEKALAGYYQGLASVRKRGMYDDTRRYIDNILALRRRLARG